MKMTAQRIMDVYLLLRRISNERRPLPQKGAYRVARMLSKMQADATPILEQYDALITSYGYIPEGKQVNEVPADKLAEFLAKWKETLGGEEHELDLEPMPIDHLDNGSRSGSLSVDELLLLDDLVTG
jgi:hypothetical protein